MPLHAVAHSSTTARMPLVKQSCCIAICCHTLRTYYAVRVRCMACCIGQAHTMPANRKQINAQWIYTRGKSTPHIALLATTLCFTFYRTLCGHAGWIGCIWVARSRWAQNQLWLPLLPWETERRTVRVHSVRRNDAMLFKRLAIQVHTVIACKVFNRWKPDPIQSEQQQVFVCVRWWQHKNATSTSRKSIWINATQYVVWICMNRVWIEWKTKKSNKLN